MSASNNNQFVGAQVPKEMAAELALASAALGVPRSLLIRQALALYLTPMKTRSPTLIDRMASRLLAKWNIMQASTTGRRRASKASVTRFCKAHRDMLLRDGIPEGVTDRIIGRLEEHLTPTK